MGINQTPPLLSILKLMLKLSVLTELLKKSSDLSLLMLLEHGMIYYLTYQWDDLLPYVPMNNSKNASIQETPFLSKFFLNSEDFLEQLQTNFHSNHLELTVCFLSNTYSATAMKSYSEFAVSYRLLKIGKNIMLILLDAFAAGQQVLLSFASKAKAAKNSIQNLLVP